MYVKGGVHPKSVNINLYPLSQLMFRRPQNISGASQRNSVAGFCKTTEEAADGKRDNGMSPCRLSSDTEAQTDVKRCYLHHETIRAITRYQPKDKSCLCNSRIQNTGKKVKCRSSVFIHCIVVSVSQNSLMLMFSDWQLQSRFPL